MKIAFLLDSPTLSGGTNVVFEYALHLVKQGVEVTMVTPRSFSPGSLDWHLEAKNLLWKTLEDLKKELFDVTVCTWWKTAYDIYKIPSRCYVYFVQSIESRFYPSNERPVRKLVEGTYLLPLHIITEAKWIQNFLADTYNKKAILVSNGVRKDIYTEQGPSISKRKPQQLRVLVEGPLNVPFKNTKKTIELCRRSLADEIWLLTSSDVKNHWGVNRVFSQIPTHETPRIYRSCDVLVKLSYVEGMFGPPLEMFHCGGTAITYDVTGYDEYIQHERNALVAHTYDEKAVIRIINDLKTHPELLSNLKEGARKTAELWPDWDMASKNFQRALEQSMAQSSMVRENLRIQSTFFYEWYQCSEMYRLKNQKKAKILQMARWTPKAMKKLLNTGYRAVWRRA